jgi:hypothetical protein
MSASESFFEPESSEAISSVDLPRELVLVKDGHRYVFTYQPGEECRVLSGLVKLVHDPDSDLNWFDAAVLSHQMGMRMGRQLQQMLQT